MRFSEKLAYEVLAVVEETPLGKRHVTDRLQDWQGTLLGNGREIIYVII